MNFDARPNDGRLLLTHSVIMTGIIPSSQLQPKLVATLSAAEYHYSDIRAMVGAAGVQRTRPELDVHRSPVPLRASNPVLMPGMLTRPGVSRPRPEIKAKVEFNSYGQ